MAYYRISCSTANSRGVVAYLAHLATLSARAFVGLVSDDPHQPIIQKVFHCKLEKEKKTGEKGKAIDLPLIRKPNAAQVQQVYEQIPKITRLNRDPGQAHLRVGKGYLK